MPDFNGASLVPPVMDKGESRRARDVSIFEAMHRILDNDPVNQSYGCLPGLEPILKHLTPRWCCTRLWCISNLRIRSTDIHGIGAVRFHNPEHKIQFEHPWPSPMTTPGHESAFYLTNAMELLDQPGEWFHDFKQQKLYYLPLDNEDINGIEAVVPAIETLILVEGTLDRPVENIRFSKSVQSYTWMRPSKKACALQAGYVPDGSYRNGPKHERPDLTTISDNQGWLGRPASCGIAVRYKKY